MATSKECVHCHHVMPTDGVSQDLTTLEVEPTARTGGDGRGTGVTPALLRDGRRDLVVPRVPRLRQTVQEQDRIAGPISGADHVVAAARHFDEPVRHLDVADDLGLAVAVHRSRVRAAA